jgi:transcriptional regulator with XRE-family HTH domain
MARAYRLSSFGIWLKCTLIEHQMTQRDFADKFGVTEPSVSRWIHGDRTPRLDELEKILDMFDCHIEILPNKE